MISTIILITKAMTIVIIITIIFAIPIWYLAEFKGFRRKHK